jgi:outer membrane autotransporter protein
LSGAAVFSFAWAPEALAVDPEYGGFSWFVDRSAPEIFETLTDYEGVNNVLHIGVSDAVPTNNYDSFYQYQGRGTWTDLPVGSALISGDLYIPAEWQNPTGYNIQNVAIWGVVGEATSNPQSYPIVGFYNGDDTGMAAGTGVIRVWDADHWETVDGSELLINYDSWNNLRLNYVSGDVPGAGSMQVLLNDEVIYTITGGDFAGYPPTYPPIDPATASLYEIILNSRTNDFRSLMGPNPGTPYDVYWSNIRAAMLVPEGVTRNFGNGTNYVADLEIDMNGIAVGGATTPYMITGNVDNLGGVLGGNVTVTGDLFNNGSVSPGNSPGITNIGGNYTPGVDANFKLEVDLSQANPVAGTDYDQVTIGGHATGSTKVFLFATQVAPPPPTVPLADTGAVVDIEDIDLITIGGTGGLDNFALGQRYLRNGMDVLLAERDEMGTTVIGLKLETPPETYDLASIPVSALTAGDVLLGTYVDRRGLDWSGMKSAWMRAVGGTSELDIGSGDIDADVVGAQFGLDLLAVGDPSTRLGVTFGYGHQSASIASPSGMETGTSDGEMPSIGGYITHAEGAFYADLLAQYRFLTYDVDAPMTSDMEVTGGSIDVAAEAGARFQVSDAVVLIPFAQLLYQHVDLDDSTTGPFSASFTDTEGLTGRLRLLAQATVGGVTGFASAGVAGDLLGDKKTTVTGVTLATDTGGPRAEFTAGVEGMVGPGLAVFGSGEVDVSFDGESIGYSGNAGLRKEF